ncbi:hypothetical protein E2C01_037713 [Portunus trituberculatus]|uniref:Uncharacterized protein n=1 Tax=Portunus trituberculatus TaxID=210409 RepID=A0A5B7FG13_PORTR|nr:hypothetical protein [Portunus trituberculatus]
MGKEYHTIHVENGRQTIALSYFLLTTTGDHANFKCSERSHSGRHSSGTGVRIVIRTDTGAYDGHTAVYRNTSVVAVYGEHWRPAQHLNTGSQY